MTALEETAQQDESAKLQELLLVSITVLEQGVDLVENVLKQDEHLTTHSQYLPGSTIGKHLRHASDHFNSLTDSWAQEPPRIMSYDTRKRGTAMESNLLAASEALKQCISQLEDVVPKAAMDAPITLQAITPYPQTVQTSFGRELWFCALHAVHHWGMVRVIAGELGFKLEESFGFAPSTLVHQGATDAPLGRKAKI
ncbi:hypothetical protein PUNSTDRAFT_48554 [Punctularia strigosozonata HHB-11173 SS5]|uniref:uncharacterized protein n=1 Tax=Punctularia strigosozonata (strain HHB-11173) TaxID=741275 RepID=UPI0004418603|nr:uncharacterized protein PUNSTDRAFT_48554 [Punctularia strigosozonata HHB-11173 SS5]EIN13612.1 hypothetical protein PUNSTDRAFT_48554 [Punctularia strigosozonata HHB-11173 SS5]